MIMESLDQYLETVAGCVFDDDKLVTYKWLSKELEVHVNIAKQILWEFWQRYKDEKDFECTFLLMGILQDDGMLVEVVKEKDLSDAKKKYSKLISEHVYSIQKVLSDMQMLDLAEGGDIRYAAIKCLENNERSDEEMHALRWGAISSEIKAVPQEQAQPVCEPNKIKKGMSPEEKQMDKKKNAERKGFNNLFGKQKNLPPSSSTEKVDVDSPSNIKQASKDVAEPSKKSVQKGGLNNFFQQGKNHSENKKEVDAPERKKDTSPTEKENTAKKIISETMSKPKNVRGKKRNRSKDSNDAAKRRKRITVQSDSSDAGSSDEEMEEVPPTPEKISSMRKRSPSPPQVKFQNGKRKVLKVVDKTFEEDGFLVTKKVHVYESCSEEEPEVQETKKPVPPEPQLKKNTKQTSLMSFFKKS